MPVAPKSPADLLELISKSGIASPDCLAAITDAAPLPVEPRKAAAALIQKGIITRFQAEQLLQGRHKGFVLGPHIVLDLLGRGGMGAVYLAEHQDLHRKVAIKVMVAPRDEDQRLANERFLREARAAAALDHPNIVRIFDVSRHQGTPYLAMEYVDGETLQQVLDRDGCLPPTTASDAIAQAAAGLQHAHERGFVHRDIKPGNLIRDRAGIVKILDMGLARSFDDPKQKLTENLDSGAVVGTADFIAPEQALNLPGIDIRADIYSLGATFFTLIAGKTPFEGNTTQKLLHHQLKSAPRLNEFDPTVPEKLSNIVAKMMAKKPADRYQTPGEVIAALSPWLGNSARVVAGLSRTNLAIGSGQFASLHDLATGPSSRRLAVAFYPSDSLSDSSEVNPLIPAPETGAVASAETARSLTATATHAAVETIAETTVRKSGRGKALLFAAAGVALVIVGVVIGRILS
ncbi:MAG TPA: serine/threonine-protein kinase [Urbifossiella sp.]